MTHITLFGGPLHLKEIDCPDHVTVWTGVVPGRKVASAGIQKLSVSYRRYRVILSGIERDIMVFVSNNPYKNLKLSEEAKEWVCDQILQGFQGN